MLKTMTSVTFDTLEFTRRLQEAGFDEKQAETVVRVLASSQENLVTREHFDAEMKLLRWMLGVVMAGILSLIIKGFF
ncbi:MAG: CCDC90 family protein [Chromatiales bacterium]